MSRHLTRARLSRGVFGALVAIIVCIFRSASFRWVVISLGKEATPQSDYANHGGVIAPGTADPGYYFDRLWRQR